MFKFNFGILLVVLIAVGRPVFCMQGQDGQGIGESQFQDLGTNQGQQDDGQDSDDEDEGAGLRQNGNNPQQGDDAQVSHLNDGNNSPPVPQDGNNTPVPPAGNSSFFTKPRVAILTCVTAAAGYLFYKYFADKNEQAEQVIDDIIDVDDNE